MKENKGRVNKECFECAEFQKLIEDRNSWKLLSYVQAGDLGFYKTKLLEVIRMWENHNTDYNVGDWNAWLDTNISFIKEFEKSDKGSKPAEEKK